MMILGNITRRLVVRFFFVFSIPEFSPSVVSLSIVVINWLIT